MERDLLRMIRTIELLRRRAKTTECAPLIEALDAAGYFAGLRLGQEIKTLAPYFTAESFGRLP